MEIDLNVNFKSNLVKQWFNDNYFISLYDNDDYLITVFNDIEEPTKFFNMPLFEFLRALRVGVIEFNHKKCRLYIFEKDKEEDYLEERGKRLC